MCSIKSGFFATFYALKFIVSHFEAKYPNFRSANIFRLFVMAASFWLQQWNQGCQLPPMCGN